MNYKRRFKRMTAKPERIGVAKVLAKIVAANGGDYQLVKSDFAAAVAVTWPRQTMQEVYEPKH